MKRRRRVDWIYVAMVLGLVLLVAGSWVAYAKIPCGVLEFLPAAETPGRCFR
jgi:hypothetical protein